MISVEGTGGDAVRQRLDAIATRLHARVAKGIMTVGAELASRAAARRRSSAGITIEMATTGDAIAIAPGTGTMRANLKAVKEAFGRPIARRTAFAGSRPRLNSHYGHASLQLTATKTTSDFRTQIAKALSEEEGA
jgi:hypothetical protein